MEPLFHQFRRPNHGVWCNPAFLPNHHTRPSSIRCLVSCCLSIRPFMPLTGTVQLPATPACLRSAQYHFRSLMGPALLPLSRSWHCTAISLPHHLLALALSPGSEACPIFLSTIKNKEKGIPWNSARSFSPRSLLPAAPKQPYFLERNGCNAHCSCTACSTRNHFVRMPDACRISTQASRTPMHASRIGRRAINMIAFGR
jgi:hypothetical protein